MNPEQSTQSSRGNPPFGAQPPSLIGKILAGMISAALLVVAFMFSLVALAIVACGAVLLGGWLWWKTRQLRQAVDAQAARQAEAGGRVIEGEVIRSASPADSGRHFPRD